MVRDRRSRRAKSVDKALMAKTVYPNTVEGRRKWRLDKAGCDLEGVDTPDAFNDLLDADFDFEGEFDSMLGFEGNMSELRRKKKDIMMGIL